MASHTRVLLHVTLQCPDLLTRHHVPNPHGLIDPRGSEPEPVGAECHVPNKPPVATASVLEQAGCGVPNLHSPIAIGRSQPPPIGAEGYRAVGSGYTSFKGAYEASGGYLP